MKKIIMAAFIAATVFTTVTKAQDVQQQQQGGGRNMGTPEERAQKQTDQLAKQLSLTDDQKKKVYDISLKNANERQKMMAAAKESGQRPDRAAMQAKMKENDAQLKTILNEDQYKKYEKLREERMSQMRNRQNGNGGGNDGGAAPANNGMDN